MWVGGFEIAECTDGLLGWPKMGEIEMGREPEEANTKGLRTVYPPAGARGQIGILTAPRTRRFASLDNKQIQSYLGSQ